MKRVFIGHRGVGKSSLLKRHQEYFPEVPHFDLDEEIEKQLQRPIEIYFKEVGEAEFRNKELQVFNLLTQKNSQFVISLGAGFILSQMPSQVEVIFISRLTDQDGRIFIDRPRLEPKLSFLEEYHKRYIERNSFYLKFATSIYHLPEGIQDTNEIEKSIFNQNINITDAYYTLSKQDLNNLNEVKKIFSKIELRTDLIETEDIEKILLDHPLHHWLVSIRNTKSINLKNAKNIDCDYLFYKENCTILSSHTDRIEIGLQQLSEINAGHQLKLCPLVESFEDLMRGHEWQQQDPQTRSFLPRSRTGKWLWYRQLSKYFQKINFIKNFTQVADQPSLSDWIILPYERPVFWGAVLGAPIHFSRSPIQHLNYFLQMNSFFTKIEINEVEFQSHFNFLVKLGLHFAAITAPLKKLAFEISHLKTQLCKELQAANTLVIKNSEIKCQNTDFIGFKELVKDILPEQSVAIWGGGGTLNMMKKVLPQAVSFSSQNGELRADSKDNMQNNFDFMIWAAPRSHKTVKPNDDIKIKQLIDLNYTENSLGLEFAAEKKISYISGLPMFKLQALKQQEFWSQL